MLNRKQLDTANQIRREPLASNQNNINNDLVHVSDSLNSAIPPRQKKPRVNSQDPTDLVSIVNKGIPSRLIKKHQELKQNIATGHIMSTSNSA